MYRSLRILALAFASLLLVAGPAQAADQSLADYKYVLHISDMDPSKQELILNNAANLLEAYPPGAVDIEIVAYGPGLRLMFANNVNAERLDSLSQGGVRFSACGNTLKGMTKLLGEEPRLNPVAKVVPGGIVRIGELVKQGYIYVKP
ncbi:MAG: DsrE family protein [Gallionellaceae bacterium]|nr:DsrE family protein [Gallionellaceae bacterium]